MIPAQPGPFRCYFTRRDRTSGRVLYSLLMLQESIRAQRSRTSLARSSRPVLALLALVALALTGAATGQASPSISLDSFNYRVGETLNVRATGLRPGASYQVTLTPPAGADADVSQSDHAADPTGRLSVSLPLTHAGRWALTVSGPDLDATLNVQVAEGITRQPATDPAGEPAATAPSEEPAAPSEEPATPPDAAEAEVEPPAVTEPTEGDPAEPAPSEETEAQPSVIAPGQRAADTTVALIGDEFVAMAQGAEAWRLSFPAGSGASAGPLVTDQHAFLARGNHLLVVAAERGNVVARHRLPAQVVAISQAQEQASGQAQGAAHAPVAVTVEFSNGARETFTVTDAGPPAGLAFDPDLDLYGWLRAEAQVEDPIARLLVDPTNPWLYVAAARVEPSRATTLLSGALAQAATFYERAQLARQLMSSADRRPDLAAQAMDAALDDFVERGYRGTLLFDEATSAAYGFPLDAMRTALERGDMPAADFWAPWLYRLSGSAVPENEAVLREYSTELRRLGRDGEANTWRQRAGEGRGFSLGDTLRDAARSLGRGGWLAVAALLVAIVALTLTLSAKYWRPQSLLLKRAADQGKKPPPLARLNVVRHASFVEKLVVVMLFAAVLALVGLHGWTERAGGLDSTLGSGSLATPVARGHLGALPQNDAAAFVDAFAVHASGDLDAAAAAYQELTADANAMNNLGVLKGDPELFRVALELRPDHSEASFNLGLIPNPSRLLDAYRPEEPLLAVPSQQLLEDAFAGSYGAALGSAFTDPWTTLTSYPAFGPQWLWVAAVVLFLAWAALSVIWLLIPRPRQSRNAPRTLLYHLLALLFPGTGLADELWGVLLLVPWAIFGTDLLRRYFLLGSGPVISAQLALTAIIVIYAINLIAFIVEYRSYRGRMARLRVTEPDLARAYGMKVDDSARV